MRPQSFRNLLSLLLERGEVSANAYAESLLAAQLLSHAPEAT